MIKEDLPDQKFRIGDLIFIDCSSKYAHTHKNMVRFNGYWLRVTKILSYLAYPADCSAEYFQADNPDKEMPIFKHDAKTWVWIPEHVAYHIPVYKIGENARPAAVKKSSLPNI